MKFFTIQLRDKKENIEREITQDFEDDFDDGVVYYMWEEGNYSCDCNRFVFFYPESDEEIDCGDDRFKLLSIEKKED